MSKLNVDQKTILAYLEDNNRQYLIPDYQRPYAWGKEECLELWNDLELFTLPNLNDGENSFKSTDEYFLGAIVTYIEDNKVIIIDGQQRITTLMLFLRAFYESSEGVKDDENNSVASVRNTIAQCIWNTGEERNQRLAVKLDSEAVSDEDREELYTILNTGKTKSTFKSQYAENYCFFLKKIEEFKQHNPLNFRKFPNRVISNCVICTIEADTQDTALRIFSTLNDRGMPLSDSDIFKAQLYKFYTSIKKKDYFVTKWKNLEEICEKIDTTIDELFNKYMYYTRSLDLNKNTSMESVRSFFEKNNYGLLKQEKTFEEILSIAYFWQNIYSQNTDYFTTDTLKLLSILNASPNILPSQFISVYYLANKDTEGKIDSITLNNALEQTIACTLLYSICKPGLAYLRFPMFDSMIKIIQGEKNIDFSNYAISIQEIKFQFDKFKEQKNLAVKFFLTWWMYQNPRQRLVPTNLRFAIEHIIPKNRQGDLELLSDKTYVEQIGNKTLLENGINIRASDNRFKDKILYYIGNKQVEQPRTINENLYDYARDAKNYGKESYTEKDIIERNNQMLDKLIKYLRLYGLVKEG